ncbi:transcription elongation factor GreA [bacterium]|nr:MAG: transcription elongation factor GreA [bacterium]RKZ15163.1 MAG: transcription elongation factor GreA [bacterium]
MGSNFFTAEGLRKLRQEIEDLERLIKVDIPRDLNTAAAHGDLRENAEYAAAKEKQAFSMTRLRELGERVRNAEIVRKRDFPDDIVTLLKRVKFKDLETGEIEECVILGDGDTDLENEIISYQSPLAASLIGHKKGEVVEAEVPGGIRRLEILDFEFFEGA